MSVNQRIAIVASCLDDADYGDRGTIVGYDKNRLDGDAIIWEVRLDKDPDSVLYISDRFVEVEEVFDY